MRRQLQRVDAVPVERTARHDYVSEVDRACEAEIVREIKRFYPQHAFLCEEGGTSGDGDSVWIIDPLDGTSNFLHGIPHFAVSIAYQHKGRTEHAVVYDPMRDELFTASRGSGAALNQKRIRVSGRKGLEGAILATAFPFRQTRLMPRFSRVFQAVLKRVEDFRRAGTASLERLIDRIRAQEGVTGTETMVVLSTHTERVSIPLATDASPPRRRRSAGGRARRNEVGRHGGSP